MSILVRPRIIPIILLDNNRAVKTTRFANPVYIGDPSNIARVFNRLCADEIIILSIDGRPINFPLLQNILNNLFIPVTYGGSINDIDDCRRLFDLGLEKLSFNRAIRTNPTLIHQAASLYGSQSVVGSIDVFRSLRSHLTTSRFPLMGSYNQYIVKYVKNLESLGIGEIFLQSVADEGTRRGLSDDFLDLAECIQLPTIISGGVGCFEHIYSTFQRSIDALAVGSYFSFARNSSSPNISYLTEHQFSLIESAITSRERSRAR